MRMPAQPCIPGHTADDNASSQNRHGTHRSVQMNKKSPRSATFFTGKCIADPAYFYALLRTVKWFGGDALRLSGT
jgi:hypothetical protein